MLSRQKPMGRCRCSEEVSLSRDGDTIDNDSASSSGNAVASHVSGLRVGFHTFGCRSNYADTVDLQAALLSEGAYPCSADEEADVYVINTCTVTDSADKDTLKLIRKLERERPGAKIVITGCMAEVKAEDLAAQPGVSSVVGPGRRSDLIKVITASGIASESPNAAAVSPTEARDVAAVHPTGRRVKKSLPLWHSISLDQPMPELMRGPGEAMGSVTNRARFHLRVQEGCENSCTFCIIPTTRGRLSSRSKELILNDIESLSALGYQEIVLSGTHLGGWGEDIGEDLAGLLDTLGRSAQVGRIRLSSIDPNDLTESCIDCLVKYPVFCNHLHICFQAFSERTLKRMNRKYRLNEAISLLEKVSTALPGCAIGSDVIAGFPGESREELEEGMELFLRLPISYLHVFPYSERSGTAATRLDGVVAPAERKRRAARWRALAQRKKDEFLTGLVGKTLEVVWESSSDGRCAGTSREFAPCVITPVANRIVRPGARLGVAAVAYEREHGEVLCELLSQESSA